MSECPISANPVRIIPFDLGRTLSSTDISLIEARFFPEFRRLALTSRQSSIRKHSAHIFVGGRQCKWFHRFLCAFPGRGIRCSQFTAQQHCHCVRVAKAVEPLHKADGMSASLLRMVIPFVASDGHAVVTGKAFFSARGKQLFTAAAQELLQIHCGGALFLFFGEMNIA